jgi:predicted nucleic acid-binding protein
MTARVFLDTDIILDLLLRREPFFPAVADLFLAVQEGRIEACVTPLIFSNLFYILRQKMPASEAVSALRKLKLLLRVLPVDEKILDLALASTFTDFEDAILVLVKSGIRVNLSIPSTKSCRSERCEP